MIRSKHNNLLNYFIFNKKDLSKAYVRKCEKFLKEFKQQAIQESVPYTDIEEASGNQQATSNDK